jgi:hypothetical protein
VHVAGGSIASTRADSGIEEMTALPDSRTAAPCWWTVTPTARPSSWWTAITGASKTTSPPSCSTSSRARSHIMPGPYFGYWNWSINVVIAVCPFCGLRALVIALSSDRFLMRWAAQSAWIVVAGTPHSFSV